MMHRHLEAGEVENAIDSSAVVGCLRLHKQQQLLAIGPTRRSSTRTYFYYHQVHARTLPTMTSFFKMCGSDKRVLVMEPANAEKTCTGTSKQYMDRGILVSKLQGSHNVNKGSQNPILCEPLREGHDRCHLIYALGVTLYRHLVCHQGVLPTNISILYTGWTIGITSPQ